MALLALLTISGLTFVLGLLCVRHHKLAALFPQFIAFGTGCLLMTCVSEFLPRIDWGTVDKLPLAAPADSLQGSLHIAHGGGGLAAPPAALFILFGILLVVLADKYLAPRLFRRRGAQNLGESRTDASSASRTDVPPPGASHLGAAHFVASAHASNLSCHEHHHSQHASFFMVDKEASVSPLAASAQEATVQDALAQGAASLRGGVPVQKVDSAQALTCSSIGCIIVCAFFDGFEIVAAFELQAATGWFVGGALLLHTLPEAVMAAGLNLNSGGTAKSATLSVGLVSGALWLGGVSFISLQNWVPQKDVLLPIATGVLLYTLLTHLLPAALKARYAWPCLGMGLLAAHWL